jgi:hypothetical protein
MQHKSALLAARSYQLAAFSVFRKKQAVAQRAKRMQHKRALLAARSYQLAAFSVFRKKQAVANERNACSIKVHFWQLVAISSPLLSASSALSASNNTPTFFKWNLRWNLPQIG